MRPSRPISGDLSGIAHPAEPNDRLTGPDTSAVTDYLKSREGRSMLNTIARGVFSMLKK